ncbi:MAG: hypothetical protein V3T72_13985 [Thermoanaerobaculia bacterium]
MKAKTFPEYTRPAVALLRQLFRRAGRGAMDRAARSLGLHRTFYSQRHHRQRFDLGAFLATLRELDTSPAAFFAQLEGGDFGGLPFPDLVAERPTPATRRAVRRAYRRMRAELGVDLVTELEDGAGGDEIPTAAGGAVLGAEWLEDLDGRRLDDPEAVAVEIAASLDQVDAAKLPAALGVWSSVLRLMIDLEAAAYLNRGAVRLARAAGDSWTEADLCLRRSYIVADAGDHGRALTWAKLAAAGFACLGADADEGRALMDCGVFLIYLGGSREAVAALEKALALIPESLPASRLGALQTLGIVSLDLGDVSAAERCAALADPLAVVPQWRAKLLWLRARIARKRGQLEESARLLRQALDIFRTVHIGEAALIAVELVQVTLEQGKPGEARQTCGSLHPLLASLEENPIIGAAVAELAAASFAGSLGLDLVERIKARIKDARAGDAKARQQWRALAVV